VDVLLRPVPVREPLNIMGFVAGVCVSILEQLCMRAADMSESDGLQVINIRRACYREAHRPEQECAPDSREGPRAPNEVTMTAVLANGFDDFLGVFGFYRRAPATQRQLP